MEGLTGGLAAEALRQLGDIVRSARGRKVKRLQEALLQPTLSPCARELIEEELNFALVQECVGLSGDRAKRQKICELVKQANGALKIGLVARASPQLSMRDGKLVSDVPPGDRGVRVSDIFGFVVLVGGAIGVAGPPILALFSGFGPPLQVLGVMLMGLMLALYGIVLISLSDSVRIAKQICPLLESLQSATPVAPAAEGLA